MRILFLTNFYPPASRGGFERWCQEVADGLMLRGHTLAILTSNYNRDAIDEDEPEWINRGLNLEMDLTSLRNGYQFFTQKEQRESENRYVVNRVVEQFDPEVVLIWGMWNFSLEISALIETLLPGRVAYYMGDYWPTLPRQIETYWRVPPRNFVTRIPKYLLKSIALRKLAQEDRPTINFNHVVFPTIFMRDNLLRQGFSPGHSKIIYGAIDTAPFSSGNGYSQNQTTDTINLLFVGRLTSEKSPETAINALVYLIRRYSIDNLMLSIIGEGEPQYEGKLQQLVQENGLDDKVTFMGALPSDELPKAYGNADIFLFTSIWPEPFGRVIVEAMASRVAIVGSSIGGAVEIMDDHVNALLFNPGDAEDLAAKLAFLIERPELRNQLSKAGRETALKKFDVKRMVMELEAYLTELAK